MSSRDVVLMIEDDADIRMATAEFLEEEGFTVVGAESVDDGLARLRDGLLPAVILLDLMMPGQTGWDFRRDQLADPALRNIPVVVISASRVTVELLQQTMGVVDLVPKPFSTVALLRAIARATSTPGAKKIVPRPTPIPATSAGNIRLAPQGQRDPGETLPRTWARRATPVAKSSTSS